MMKVDCCGHAYVHQRAVSLHQRRVSLVVVCQRHACSRRTVPCQAARWNWHGQSVWQRLHCWATTYVVCEYTGTSATARRQTASSLSHSVLQSTQYKIWHSRDALGDILARILRKHNQHNINRHTKYTIPRQPELTHITQNKKSKTIHLSVRASLLCVYDCA